MFCFGLLYSYLKTELSLLITEHIMYLVGE